MPRFEHAIRHTLNRSGTDDAIQQAQDICGMTDREARAYIAELNRTKPIATDDVMGQLWRRHHRRPWQQED